MVHGQHAGSDEQTQTGTEKEERRLNLRDRQVETGWEENMRTGGQPDRQTGGQAIESYRWAEKWEMVGFLKEQEGKQLFN